MGSGSTSPVIVLDDDGTIDEAFKHTGTTLLFWE